MEEIKIEHVLKSILLEHHLYYIEVDKAKTKAKKDYLAKKMKNCIKKMNSLAPKHVVDALFVQYPVSRK